jgi:DNA-binding PadR family transcriptional regulator
VGHAFLGMLDRGPQHGYALKRDYDHWFGDGRELRFGQVYATLGRLERDGLANVAAVEAGDGPDRKSYAITADGVQELESWLASPVPPDEATLGPLYAKVVVALLSGRAADDVLAAQRKVHLARMRELRAHHEGAGFERQLALDLLIGHLQADLDWIELSGARLARRERANAPGRRSKAGRR